MPKLPESGTTRKISIHDIIETGNVRADYQDIEDLAASIKKTGLLEPILVKIAEPGPDGPRYELIAGHRRLRAHFYLVEKGDDFSTIEAKFVTGDKLILQLVENLQRSDLSPRDREKGIWQMSEIPGVTQREIAANLSKNEYYISRQIAAYKTRKIAEDAGIDTSALETSALAEIQAAAEKDIPMLIGYTIRGGGTVAAAKAIMRDYRPAKRDKPPAPEAPAETPLAPPVESPAEAPPPATGEGSDIDPLKENTEPGTVTIHKPSAQGHTTALLPPEPRPSPERVKMDLKKVLLDDVFDEVYGYLSGLEKRIRESGMDTGQGIIDGYKREAALDIIALVQARFKD